MGDGLLGKCKECTKKDSTKHREENIEKFILYDRKRAMLPHRVKQRKDYYKKYAKRRIAKNTLWDAIERGAFELKKMPCEECGEKETVMHHDDYSKPLKIRWLCRSHHRKWHVSNTPKGD